MPITGLPAAGPTTLDLVKAQLDITDNADDATLSPCVDAVNAVVRTWRCSTAASGQAEWPDDIERGATMLAARLWRRRNTPDGVTAMAEGGPVYVQRNDPDVAMLLRLGVWASPAVG